MRSALIGTSTITAQHQVGAIAANCGDDEAVVSRLHRIFSTNQIPFARDFNHDH